MWKKCKKFKMWKNWKSAKSGKHRKTITDGLFFITCTSTWRFYFFPNKLTSQLTSHIVDAFFPLNLNSWRRSPTLFFLPLHIHVKSVTFSYKITTHRVTHHLPPFSPLAHLCLAPTDNCWCHTSPKHFPHQITHDFTQYRRPFSTPDTAMSKVWLSPQSWLILSSILSFWYGCV
jgi:hypothetical protein